MSTGRGCGLVFEQGDLVGGVDVGDEGRAALVGKQGAGGADQGIGALGGGDFDRSATGGSEVAIRRDGALTDVGGQQCARDVDVERRGVVRGVDDAHQAD